MLLGAAASILRTLYSLEMPSWPLFRLVYVPTSKSVHIIIIVRPCKILGEGGGFLFINCVPSR